MSGQNKKYPAVLTPDDASGHEARRRWRWWMKIKGKGSLHPVPTVDWRGRRR